ncbi:hypothetical protein CL8139_350033 [Cellulophaga lytica]|nr:hypothetical protein CL8139_350033 [Cellulophaga lytica]
MAFKRENLKQNIIPRLRDGSVSIRKISVFLHATFHTQIRWQ